MSYLESSNADTVSIPAFDYYVTYSGSLSGSDKKFLIETFCNVYDSILTIKDKPAQLKQCVINACEKIKNIDKLTILTALVEYHEHYANREIAYCISLSKQKIIELRTEMRKLNKLKRSKTNDKKIIYMTKCNIRKCHKDIAFNHRILRMLSATYRYLNQLQTVAKETHERIKSAVQIALNDILEQFKTFSLS